MKPLNERKTKGLGRSPIATRKDPAFRYSCAKSGALSDYFRIASQSRVAMPSSRTKQPEMVPDQFTVRAAPHQRHIRGDGAGEVLGGVACRFIGPIQVFSGSAGVAAEPSLGNLFTQDGLLRVQDRLAEQLHALQLVFADVNTHCPCRHIVSRAGLHKNDGNIMKERNYEKSNTDR